MLSSRCVRTGRIAGRDCRSNDRDAGLNIVFQLIGNSSTFYGTDFEDNVSLDGELQIINSCRSRNVTCNSKSGTSGQPINYHIGVHTTVAALKSSDLSNFTRMIDTKTILPIEM